MSSNLVELYKFFKIFALFGHFPVKSKTSEKAWTPTFYRIHSVFYFVLYFCLNILVIYQHNLENRKDEKKSYKSTFSFTFSKLFFITIGVLYFVKQIASIVESCLSFNSIEKYFSNIDEINEIAAQNFMKKLNYHKFIRFHLTLSLIHLLFCVVKTLFFNQHSFWAIMISIFDYYTNFFQFYRFFILVSLVNYHLNYVSEILDEFFEVENYNIELRRRFKSNLSQKSFARQNRNQISKFQSLWKIYSLIEDCSSLIMQYLWCTVLLEYLSFVLYSIRGCYVLAIYFNDETSIKKSLLKGLIVV